MSPAIIPIPAVNIAVLNPEGELLLTLRSDKVREPGKWCLPGGHIELGEDWATAMRRELVEETGLVAEDYRLVGIYSDPGLTVTPMPVQGGSRAQYVVALFLVTRFTGSVCPNDEVADWDWFPADHLPEPIIPSHPVRALDAVSFNGEAFVR